MPGVKQVERLRWDFEFDDKCPLGCRVVNGEEDFSLVLDGLVDIWTMKVVGIRVITIEY